MIYVNPSSQPADISKTDVISPATGRNYSTISNSAGKPQSPDVTRSKNVMKSSFSLFISFSSRLPTTKFGAAIIMSLKLPLRNTYYLHFEIGKVRSRIGTSTPDIVSILHGGYCCATTIVMLPVLFDALQFPHSIFVANHLSNYRRSTTTLFLRQPSLS